MLKKTVDLLETFSTLPQPEPAGGGAYFSEIKNRAIHFSTERKENYEKFLQWKKNGGVVRHLPVKLDIENVSRCNFRCVTCVVSDWKNGKRAEDMTVGAFKKLIDEQIGLIEIKLQGIGEPLMQGNDLFEMISYARSRKIWVRITTNASLLHLHDSYARLIDVDTNEIQISIDGADKNTFEKIRRGSKFERVIDNVKLINAYAREKGVERTKMWTVVQRENAHQLDELVEFAAELGFTNQVFMLQPVSWGLDPWVEKISKLTVADELEAKKLHGLVEKGRGQGVRVAFWVASEKFSTNRLDRLCPWPFERAFVGSDLRTSPCCMIGNPDVFEIGNGIEKSFSEVWFSEEYHQFRKAHEDGVLPEVCKMCYDERSQ